MSITALITGKLIADPEQRVGQSGKPFTLAKLATQTDDGDALVSVIAFGSIAEQLAALTKGDSASMTGKVKVSTWAGKDGATKAGLSITADVLLTAYHMRRKRAVMHPTTDAGKSPSRPAAPQGDDGNWSRDSGEHWSASP